MPARGSALVFSGATLECDSLFFIIDERTDVVIHMDLSKFQARRRPSRDHRQCKLQWRATKSHDLSGTSGTVVWQNHLIDHWAGQAILDLTACVPVVHR
ncbi:hypothetical protein J4G43_044155 [Bradyrhizobium barranii subsp. barranii]|uniref:Uncharacterized protein n=1 Tax=Bradyrhizobium barranii subsp. barranii TaxID=2823807 RepID=A0A939S8W1_9BRAD|nr:hypothetical protein [Bradyrhizobium barranii]UEM11442.1 hypothetical protein J4G43_044155 [Bradyrhizobium barranii subsp. barranii]